MDHSSTKEPDPNLTFGMDNNARSVIVNILNYVLANEMMLIVKTLNAYWNVSGEGLLEKRIIFYANYTQLIEIVEKLAERIRVLGGLVICDLKEFFKVSRLKESSGKVPGFLDMLADHEVSIHFLHDDARKCLDQGGDEVSHTLLMGIMDIHEKLAWILRLYIDPELNTKEGKIRKGQRIQIAPN